MASFHRVEADHAGPTALGILVPPGRRTFVILRPRALPWDLLLCRGPEDLVFRDLAHDEASAAAQGLFRALRDEVALVEPIYQGPTLYQGLNGPSSAEFRLRVVVGSFAFLVCPRWPGQPYVPLTCAAETASLTADQLSAVLCPEEGSEQEVYFNVRFFDQSAK